MDYILSCENCEARCIEMVIQNGELMAKGIGEKYFGTIVLESICNKDNHSISSKCIKDSRTESIKRIFLLRNYEEFCCFTFNDIARENGETAIRMQVQSDSSVTHYIFICYSSSTNKGTAYLVPNYEELKRWAKKLCISTYEVLDSIGKLVSYEYFQEQ